MSQSSSLADSRCVVAISALLLAALGACASGSTPQGEERVSAPQPNVIVVITDDQGYGDFGYAGNPVLRTPHLDRLAAESTRIERFYVCPVCAPTRASLMTGRWHYRTGVIDTYQGRAMMAAREHTIAESLRDAGYATGIFGKWHLGDCYPMRPQDQGFDVSLVHRGGGIGQSSDPPGGERKYTNATLWRNGKAEVTKGYCSDVYFGEAMSWIDRVARERDRPFFAYIADNCPHGPFGDVPPKLYEGYKGIDLGNDRFDARGAKLPAKTNEDRRARIFAMISNIDRNIGELTSFLARRGLARDTILVFLTDNGPNGARYVRGLRGQKGSMYEGGIRSPLLVRWPAGGLRPGVVHGSIGAHVDLMPTLLEACGVAAPVERTIDGKSLLTVLRHGLASPGRGHTAPGDAVAMAARAGGTSKAGAHRARDIVLQAHRGNEPQRGHHFTLIADRYKLVRASGFHREKAPSNAAYELYDLERDPFEQNDLAAQEPERVAAMRARYDAWFDEVQRERPKLGELEIHVGTRHENPTTLTRQDWRREFTSWNRGSRVGTWLVRARAGRYRVRARFGAAKRNERLVLTHGTRRAELAVRAGATQATLEVELDAVSSELRAELRSTGATTPSRGVHQLDVERL